MKKKKIKKRCGSLPIICRSATFMIADGVVPSNVERGYILRRLIRRAIRQGKILGIENNFAAKIAEVVIAEYKETYPELEREAGKIIEELNQEEVRFRETLEKGLKKIKEIIAESRKDEKISGEKAFYLFSTFGFPLELTKEIAEEHSMAVDEEGFHEAVQKASGSFANGERRNVQRRARGRGGKCGAACIRRLILLSGGACAKFWASMFRKKDRTSPASDCGLIFRTTKK